MKNIFLTTSVSALVAGLAATAGASAQTLDYTMMSELFGEPVTAGATGAPQRASDVPATMIIITQDDIQRFPEYDIPGILRHYAGIDYNRYGYGDGQLSIRGPATPNNPRLLVLVNGRDVYLDSYGYTAWSTLPVQLEEIQQIEVVKGAQSALYGFNAVSGVVNIITRNPQLEEYATSRVNVAENGGYDAAFVAAYQFNERAGVRVSYSHGEMPEFGPFAQSGRAALLAPFDFTRETGAVEGRFTLTDDISLTAEATFSNVDQLELTSGYSSARGVYDLQSFKGQLDWDSDFGFISAQAYRNETNVDYTYGSLRYELTTYRVQDLFKIGTNDTVRVGVEYREASTGSFPLPGNGDFGYESTAFSAMWNHKFSNTLDVTLAGRLDRVDWSRDGQPDPTLYPFSQAEYSVTYEEFSYNAAVVWHPEFGGTFRFMAGRGVQAPTSWDIGFTLALNVGGNNFVVSGNPGMVPSIVDSYEIAYDRSLTETINMRAAIFRQDTADVRGLFGLLPDLLPPDAPGPVSLFDNRGDTSTSGVEIAFEGDPEGAWDWGVNYTYQVTEDDLEGVWGLNYLHDFEAMTPAHTVNAHLGWTGERFSADVYANYLSDTASPYQTNLGSLALQEIDSALALSVRAAYRVNDHVSASFNVQNASFGDGELTNVNTETESRAWFGLSASF